MAILRRICFLALFCAAPGAGAVDGMLLHGGVDFSDRADVDMVRLGLRWDWDRRWFEGGDWYLSGHSELEFGYWDGRGSAQGNDSITDISARPVVRLLPHRGWGGGVRPYVEASVGVHLLSDTEIDGRDLSTAFQFGSFLGAGVTFGPGKRFELGYRITHISNASIKQPNEGIDFHLLHMGYRF